MKASRKFARDSAISVIENADLQDTKEADHAKREDMKIRVEQLKNRKQKAEQRR